MQPFFITGLPRSRTAWIAALLTEGPTFCWHDATKWGASVKALEKLFRWTPERVKGDADSGLAVLAPEIVQRWPTARWLFVRRDPEQCLASFNAMQQRDPYPNAPRTLEQARLVFTRGQTLLDDAWNAIPENFRREVDFAALDDHKTVSELAFFLTGNLISPQRHALFQGLRVEVIGAKAAAMPPGFGHG